MKKGNIKNWPTEKISQRVLYILIGIIVVLFALFFLIGFDMPYIDDPDFNAPLFTDLLIWFMVLLLLAAVVVAGYSLWTDYKYTGKAEKIENGVPEAKIKRYTWLGTISVLILTFVFGSSATMLVNGRNYAEWFWLKTSDMFVWTSIVLFIVAIGAVLYGATKYRRKKL